MQSLNSCWLNLDRTAKGPQRERLISRFSVVVTGEEHTVLGGLGGAVAEVIAEAGISTTFRRFGLPATFPTGVGSQQYLRTANRLDAQSLQALVTAAQPTRG